MVGYLQNKQEGSFQAIVCRFEVPSCIVYIHVIANLCLLVVFR